MLILKVKGLFKGVLPPMVMQGAINAIVFGVERATSRFLSPILGSGPQKEVIIGTCAGMTAGFVQTIVCAPMELVKLQTQHQAIGQATSYQGNLATLRNIVRWGGVKGCYQGFWITALRDTPAFGVYFATYEGLMHFTAESKGIGRKDLGWQFSFYYGGCAGVASWLVNYPVDLVKTRIQLDGGSGKVRQYRSSWDCFMKIWNEGGVRLLYRGLGPCLIRAFANSAFVFVAYEATSHYLYRL